MATPRFPDLTPESIGQFVIVDAQGAEQSPKRTGVVRYIVNRVALEVSPEFSSSIEWVEQENGTWAGRSPRSEPADFVVLGSLATSPSSVTLWGVNTTGRRSIGWAFQPDTDAPGNHEMRADWCFVGAHLSDRRTKFTEIRLDVTNLHDWAGLSSVRHTVPLDGTGPRSWTVELPDAPQSELWARPGRIELLPSSTASAPSFSGFEVSTTTRALVMLEDDGAPLEDMLFQFAGPLASLMTLLSGAECAVRGAELSVDGTNRATLYGYQIDSDAAKSAGDLLMRRDDFDDDFLARWLDVATTMSPVPQILAAAWSNDFVTIDAEALTLATVAEMLHRRLHPGAIRFTPSEIAAARLGVDDADIPDKVKQSFVTALDGWWAEMSYPQRLTQLAEPVAGAVPSSVGKLSRWKKAVTEQRVGAAHGLDDAGSTQTSIRRLYTLTRSLRWVLTFRLLLAAGVRPQQLSQAVTRSERYARDRRMWTRDWPDIYNE